MQKLKFASGLWSPTLYIDYDMQIQNKYRSLWTEDFPSCCHHIEQTVVVWSVTSRHRAKTSTSGRANRLYSAITNMLGCMRVLKKYWRHTKQSVSFGPEQPPAHSRWQQSLTYGPKQRPSHCSAHTVLVTEKVTERQVRKLFVKKSVF